MVGQDLHHNTLQQHPYDLQTPCGYMFRFTGEKTLKKTHRCQRDDAWCLCEKVFCLKTSKEKQFENESFKVWLLLKTDEGEGSSGVKTE